ncbi:MAG TPA: hypothetical protein VGY55_19300 [Pirellulales bacterium]|nr:hypothetical protein [Pirellulales bacterium]
MSSLLQVLLRIELRLCRSDLRLCGADLRLRKLLPRALPQMPSPLLQALLLRIELRLRRSFVRLRCCGPCRSVLRMCRTELRMCCSELWLWLRLLPPRPPRLAPRLLPEDLLREEVLWLRLRLRSELWMCRRPELRLRQVSLCDREPTPPVGLLSLTIETACWGATWQAVFFVLAAAT